ncbi:uncharacterized protein FIBRA_01583 [Fibroporia radiculosa]|uniref:Major facilitator superfamily (MFS) profile domain-containing protein n=1 Tax=Fibroporia radiculosa TaxID=599839 RepID=J4GKP2_9APHY|nr:uncharacterized protein FIBRA_01583 [Fibroporia radiculosa]CCL99565.1 predicted protein [Fibroporia radiculosa]
MGDNTLLANGNGNTPLPRTSTETLQAATAPETSTISLTTPDTTIARDLGFLPIPRRLRYDPEHPAHFGLVINATFGFASTFVVANLYYCQPLLIEFSKSFGVTYDEVSRIPTLIQAGYAVGILLISTLGDLVRRRPLILLLVFISGALTIGLAITKSLVVFEALSFLVGMTSVVPQILMPLAADLAPPERRASALSIVLAGLLFGVLIARVLAGIIAEFVTWRAVYYFAIGVQYLVLLMMYLVLPDYPAKNKGATYFGILFSMAKFAVTEPVLIQAYLINLPSSACFTNFWVTLTFLLGDAPYHYSTLVIGLFGLVGIFGVAMAPFVGRLIDGLIPWFATVTAIMALLVFQAIAVGADGVNIAAVVIVCFGLDVFRQMAQVSLTTRVFSLDPNARARLNAVLLLSLFMGQVMGTSVGSQVFTKYGWRPAAALSVAWTGFMLFMILLRGPHVPRYTWLGYKGGIEVRKSRLARSGVDSAVAAVTAEPDAAPTSDEKKREASDPPNCGDVEKAQIREKDKIEVAENSE